MYNKTPFLLAAMLIATAAHAQKSLTESSSDKYFKMPNAQTPKPKVYKMDFINVAEDGHGKMPLYSKLNIKRVAIINFTMKDVVHKQSGSFDAGATTTYWHTSVASSGAAVDLMGDTCYTIAKKALKDVAAKNGMEILTLPDLFAKQPELEKIYTDFDFEASKLMKVGIGFSKSLDGAIGDKHGRKSDGKICLMDNSRYVDAAYWLDYKYANGLGKLAKALGVDAVIAINTSMFWDEDGMYLQDINLQMFGPNPVPKVAGKKYIGNGVGYNDGLHYTGFNLVSKEGVRYLQYGKKRAIKNCDLSGYATIINKGFQDCLDRMKAAAEITK